MMFLLAVIFAYTSWTRRKIYKEVDRLDDWKMEIMYRPIADDIGKVKGLKMSGETEKKFEQWRMMWDEIITVFLPDLEEDLLDVENYINKYRFKKAKLLNQEILRKLEEVELELKTLLEDVDSLVNSEEQNRAEITEIRKFYYEVKKFFSVHRGSFGKSAALLEERLEVIYEQFTQFETATEDGNYLEARELLNQIKTETTNIQEMMKEIPKLLVQFNSHIANDLKNIEQGLKEMGEEGYALQHFAIEKDIERITNECGNALSKVDVLELDDSQARLKEINDQIDQMYTVLEIEVESKAMVQKSIKTIQQRIEVTNDQIEDLHFETDLVQQSYRISEEELKYQQHLSKQLKNLVQKFSTIDSMSENKEQSYTSIQEFILEFNQDYDLLEKSINNSKQKLSALREGELKATATLKELKSKLIEARRLVQLSNVPGLPGLLVNQVALAEQKVQDALLLLANIPLDMNSVTKKVEVAIAHVETVISDIEKTIKTAEFAEQLIQYGNRYRNRSNAVSEQLNEAEIAFRAYHYDGAISLVELAISPLDPNVKEKVTEFVSSL
jgi:septation ring formation regulator